MMYSAYDYRTVGSEDGILVVSMGSGDPIDVCRANNIQTLLHGIPQTTSAASQYKDALRTALVGDSPTTQSMARANMNSLLDLDGAIVSGAHLPNPDWEQGISHLLYDPNATIALIEAQYRDSSSGDAISNLDHRLWGLAVDYRQNGVQTTTPFLEYASTKLGVGTAW